MHRIENIILFVITFFFCILRYSYTRRIYEIIGNINKQNNEIQKILGDTRALQKEIKILTEQIERSFTSADELIFYVSIVE